MEPRSLDIPANQLRHRVLEWDGGGDATVLCLHGFLDLAWGFAPLAPLLAEAGYHVIAPDLRGHGDTERIGRGAYYHFMDYLFDVADLVDALSRRRLFVVGHSMGGAIASLWAGAFPDRPEKVAVLEGLAATEVPLDELPARAAAWVASVRKAREREGKVHPSVEAAAKRLRDHDPRCSPELALFLAEKGTKPVPGGVSFKHDPVHLTRGPYPFRLEQARRFWQAIRCPVLIVDAAESELTVPDLEARAALFPTATHTRVADAGHMMIRHQPAAIARTLLAFFEGR